MARWAVPIRHDIMTNPDIVILLWQSPNVVMVAVRDAHQPAQDLPLPCLSTKSRKKSLPRIEKVLGRCMMIYNPFLRAIGW